MLNLRRRRDAGPTAAEALYAHAVERSRQPALYAKMGAPDTVEGRFELLTAHIILTVERLNAEGEQGRGAGQSLFDLYVRNLDSALREMGVGDMAVSKRMKSLAKIFYGRAVAYAEAFASPRPGEIDRLVARTILAERVDADPAALADYLREERARLVAMNVEALTLGSVA
jgi:cytochrome b pre-mRNA-processing protein 3